MSFALPGFGMKPIETPRKTPVLTSRLVSSAMSLMPGGAKRIRIVSPAGSILQRNALPTGHPVL
jgi:hypothetical protein